MTNFEMRYGWSCIRHQTSRTPATSQKRALSSVRQSPAARRPLSVGTGSALAMAGSAAAAQVFPSELCRGSASVGNQEAHRNGQGRERWANSPSATVPELSHRGCHFCPGQVGQGHLASSVNGGVPSESDYHGKRPQSKRSPKGESAAAGGTHRRKVVARSGPCSGARCPKAGVGSGELGNIALDRTFPMMALAAPSGRRPLVHPRLVSQISWN